MLQRFNGWQRGVLLTLMMVGLFAASRALAEEEAIRGVVAETMNSGGYTYLLLDHQGTKEWFAVPESLVRVGDEVLVQPGMQMGSYTSKTLDRTFDTIVFSPGISGMLKRVVKSADDQDAARAAITIAKAKGPNAYSVAEIFDQKDALNGKPVVVRGQVVKSSQYAGLQWLRIIDGSGSSKRGNHKLVVTTAQKAAKDDVVVVSGIVKTDKAFGALTYEVVVEDAKLEKEEK